VDVFALLEAVQAIARTGLHYTDDPYDRERYQSLLDLAVAEYADRVGLSPDDLRERFATELGSVTPKVGADAAIIDENERMLLVRRADNGRWGLIAGWVEPNEHPAATVVREAAEEVGLEVEVTRLAGIGHRPASAEAGPHSTVSVVYLCRVVSGHITTQPHEVIEAQWRHVHDVDEWHLNHAELAAIALESHRAQP
jgi:ADP-ribose pyrophosphatase YjhB (NUDIX family)